MITYEDLADWQLPNGEEMFFEHKGSFITTNETDLYLGAYGAAWFSVRPHKGQWWLHFVVTRALIGDTKIELPPTAEEALAWMKMVVEVSGTKQERRK